MRLDWTDIVTVVKALSKVLLQLPAIAGHCYVLIVSFI